jgi:hypothetical protein
MKDTRNRFFFGVFVGFIVAGFFFFFFYRGASAQPRSSAPPQEPRAAASGPSVMPNYHLIPVNAPRRIPSAEPRNPASVIVDPEKDPGATPVQDDDRPPRELAARHEDPLNPAPASWRQSPPEGSPNDDHLPLVHSGTLPAQRPV